MQLTCPIPQYQHDVITLGHGGGGMLTHQLLQSGVFDILHNEFLDQQHDGAVIPVQGRIAMSTDSFVISPIFFPGGNIGELAVNGTVNDLAMCGAIPAYLTLGFIIEEGLLMEELHTIIHTIQQAAGRAGVQIVSGDTKVVEKGKGDKIFINTTGIGHVHPAASIHHKNIKLGDKIIISGQVANHGIAIMSKRKGLEFDSDIISDTAPLNHIIKNLLDQFGSAIHFLRDPTRGGVASVLNEIARITPHGYLLLQNEIPVNEQVEGACEMLGLDPLYVANEGIFIAIVDEAIAPQLLAVLQQDVYGQKAAIIGEVVSEHPGKVIMQSRIGGKRVVNYLAGEQLPRIC